MCGVPTIEEEITRKGLNALAMVQADKENSRINIDTFSYVMRVLHEAYAGIADDEFIDVMNQMTKPEMAIIEFENGGKEVSMEVDKTFYTINFIGRKQWRLDTHEQFVNKVKQIASQLIDKGFKRVK